MDAIIAAFLVQDGLSTGAIYILLAVALVMVFTVTRIVLVPQGEFVVFAAFALASLEQGQTPAVVWLLLVAGGLAFLAEAAAAARRRSPAGLVAAAVPFLLIPVLLAVASRYGIAAETSQAVKIALAVALITAFGPILYRIAFQPMAAASPLTLLIAALAVHWLLVGIGLYLFGAEGVRTEALADGQWQLGAITVSVQSVLVIGTCALLNVLLFVFFGRNLYGKALRATAVHRRGALLVGISADLAGQITFALAAFIGAISGVLIAPVTTLYYDSGFILGLKGFVGAIIGGLTAYPAAAFGALLVAMLESFASFWASAFKESIVFTLIVPVLLWRSLTHVGGDDEGY